MSQWTHVAGVIRYDALRGFGLDSRPVIGHPVSFGDPPDTWKQCDMPMGSEGSLQFRLYENPDQCCVQAYTVTIEGDLRSYDEWDEILAWFNKLAKIDPKKGYWIRQACFTVDVEGQAIRTYHYDPDKKEFIQ